MKKGVKKGGEMVDKRGGEKGRRKGEEKKGCGEKGAKGN